MENLEQFTEGARPRNPSAKQHELGDDARAAVVNCAYGLQRYICNAQQPLMSVVASLAYVTDVHSRPHHDWRAAAESN